MFSCERRQRQENRRSCSFCYPRFYCAAWQAPPAAFSGRLFQGQAYERVCWLDGSSDERPGRTGKIQQPTDFHLHICQSPDEFFNWLRLYYFDCVIVASHLHIFQPNFIFILESLVAKSNEAHIHPSKNSHPNDPSQIPTPSPGRL